MITKLEQIVAKVKDAPNKRIVAAYANDAHTIEALCEAYKLDLADATLVGCEQTIRKVAAEHNFDISNFIIFNEPIDSKAAAKAVELVAKGEGDILMKGLVSTDKYMKAILNKDAGLMSDKATLTHVTVIENPNYHKLLVVGDVAILPAPDLKQKIAITEYLIKTAKKLGIEKPKVAIIGAAENVSLAMPASIDAAILSKMSDRGQISGAFIEGPLSIDLAIDMESVQIKGMKNEVAGDADCLLFPNIEAGNVFYKTNTKLANAELAALVMGAKVPCVLSSRGDSAKTKMYSIALAALMV